VPATLLVPLGLNVLVPVVPESKHVVAVVKTRFATVMELLLPCVKVALKVSSVAPSELVKVAAQLPVNVPLELPPPHAISIVASAHHTERHQYLILPSEKTTTFQTPAAAR